MTDNTNLVLWESMKTVDRTFTKPIVGKSYKGDSPNPTYIIRKITEQLGPIGQNWGFTVQFDRVREGKPHQLVTKQHVEYGPPDADGKPSVATKTVEYQILREEYHEVCIRFWFLREDGTAGHFDAYGGTPMLYQSKSGNWMHDEDAAKKSLTDAYTKGASWLGACADIFLGLFDDKYTSTPDEPPSSSSSAPPSNDDAPKSPSANGGSRETSTPAGW